MLDRWKDGFKRRASRIFGHDDVAPNSTSSDGQAQSQSQSQSRASYHGSEGNPSPRTPSKPAQRLSMSTVDRDDHETQTKISADSNNPFSTNHHPITHPFNMVEPKAASATHASHDSYPSPRASPKSSPYNNLSEGRTSTSSEESFNTPPQSIQLATELRTPPQPSRTNTGSVDKTNAGSVDRTNTGSVDRTKSATQSDVAPCLPRLSFTRGDSLATGSSSLYSDDIKNSTQQQQPASIMQNKPRTPEPPFEPSKEEIGPGPESAFVVTRDGDVANTSRQVPVDIKTEFDRVQEQPDIYFDHVTHMRNEVTHEEIKPHLHTIYEPQRTVSYHYHEHRTVIQPIIDPEPKVLPEQHWAQDHRTGEIFKIPDELGRKLDETYGRGEARLVMAEDGGVVSAIGRLEDLSIDTKGVVNDGI